MTWNIEHGQRIPQAIDSLTNHDDLSGVDLLLVQEMDDSGMAELAAALDLYWIYVSAGLHSSTNRHFGNGVLSRWPLDEPEVLELPFRARIMGENRIAVRATTMLGGQELDLWSIHAEVSTLSNRKQVQQYRALREAVAASSRRPAIIGGDFNTASRRNTRGLERAMLEARGVPVSADAGPTFRRFRRDFRLDHIFARGIDAIDVGVAREHDASDHHPVWATFAFG